jgi:hypothetical protein
LAVDRPAKPPPKTITLEGFIGRGKFFKVSAF